MVVAPGPTFSIDGNGVVEFTDVILVLGEWGSSGFDATLNLPDADIDGDGVVAFGDVIDVLGAWGQTG